MRILVLFVSFVATVFGANWALEEFGFVTVAPGIMAPAGVFFAGVAFTLRDLLHDQRNGPKLVLGAIAAGALASYSIAPAFAMASASAFLLSELADFAVYTPLRKRGWLLAVAASNVVGFTVDSVLFLWLAFGSLDFIEGQLIGKAYMTLLGVIAVTLIRLKAKSSD